MLLRMFESKRATRSAGEPKASIRAKPAVPATAARGLSPDAPAAAPAKILLAGMAVLVMLFTAVPAIAACLPANKHSAGQCRSAQRQLQLKQAVRPAPVVAKTTVGSGGGSTLDLRRLAPDLMP